MTCKKVRGKSYDAPPMASLSEFRVRESFPFSKVGVDFAGPLYVKGKTKEMNKVYISSYVLSEQNKPHAGVPWRVDVAWCVDLVLNSRDCVVLKTREEHAC